MRFQLIDRAKQDFPVHRLCHVLGVSQSGYFSWKDRPASRRQRDDMVMLAHVRSAFALSNGTYGSPRMTRELQDDGFAIGRRRTARLMRENGLRGRQKRRFKRTTDSEHAWPVAPNIIDQDFTAAAPNQKWGVDISYVWKDGSIRPWSSTSSPAASSAGLSATACTATWRSRPCATPSSCGVRPKGSFIIRTAAANIVPWSTRPSCAATASASPCRERGIATTMPWSRRSSRPSNPNSSGERSSTHVPRPQRPLPAISTASTTPSGATPRLITPAQHSSNVPCHAEQMPLHLSGASPVPMCGVISTWHRQAVKR